MQKDFKSIQLKNEISSTMIHGFRNFISKGILVGELNSDMTLVELLNKLDELYQDKNKGYQNKLRGMERDGMIDDNFQ